MKQQTRPSSGSDKSKVDAAKTFPAPNGPFAGRPLDGSQYLDVTEEQVYADKPPTQEEQRPRYSYLNKKEEKGRRR